MHSRRGAPLTPPGTPPIEASFQAPRGSTPRDVEKARRQQDGNAARREGVERARRHQPAVPSDGAGAGSRWGRRLIIAEPQHPWPG